MREVQQSPKSRKQGQTRSHNNTERARLKTRSKTNKAMVINGEANKQTKRLYTKAILHEDPMLKPGLIY